MIPVHLEMENFLSHSHSELHFNFSSALVIGEYDGDQYMSNGAGKSAIFEALAWALFGKSRCKYADSIVKDGRPSCKVTLTFMHDDKTYKVVRVRNAKYASQNSLEFFEVLDDGAEEPIKADTNTELDKKIREVISSSYEVFVNSSYFKQGDISGFLNGKASDRQKIVSSILNLDRWNKYKDIADKRYKEIDKELSLLKYKLAELKDLDSQISELENGLDEDKQRNAKLIKDEELLAEQVRALEVKVSNIKTQDSSLSDYQTTKNKYEYACAKVIELGNAQEQKKKLIKSSLDDIAKNKEAIAHAEAKILELTPALEIKDKLNIDEFERKLMKGRVRFDLLISQVENLEANDECHACGTVWADAHKKHSEIEKKQEELSELQAKIGRAEARLNAKKEKFKEICQIELEIDKYSSRCKNFANSNELHELRANSAKNELELIETNITETVSQRDSLEQILKDMQKIFDESDFNAIVAELDAKKVQKKSLTKDKEDLIYQIGATTHKLESLYKDREKKKSILSDIDKLNREAAVFSNLVRSFGRNGIQAIIVDNVMEELAKVTNEQLNEFTSVPTYVDFITQKKDSKGSWKETLEIDIRTPTGIREFDSLSGGEAFRVAFAIRLALSAIQARRMGGQTQLLMLDEVSTSLDKHGLEAFVHIIRRLERDLKVMVITHDDKFKEEFDHIVMVKKSGEDSSIMQS